MYRSAGDGIELISRDELNMRAQTCVSLVPDQSDVDFFNDRLEWIRADNVQQRDVAQDRAFAIAIALCGWNSRIPMRNYAVAVRLTPALTLYTTSADDRWETTVMLGDEYTRIPKGAATTYGEFLYRVLQFVYPVWFVRIPGYCQYRSPYYGCFPVVLRRGNIIETVNTAVLTLRCIDIHHKSPAVSFGTKLIASPTIISYMEKVLAMQYGLWLLDVQLPSDMADIRTIDGNSWGLAAAVMCLGVSWLPRQKILVTGGMDGGIVNAVGDIDSKAEFAMKNGYMLAVPGNIPTQAAALYASLIERFKCKPFPASNIQGTHAVVVSVQTPLEAAIAVKSR